MFHPLDRDERIPLTPFTIGFIVERLNDAAEWRQLYGGGGKPPKVRVESLSGKGYLSAVHRLTFAAGENDENEAEGKLFRVVLKVPTIAVLQQIRPEDSQEKMAYMAQTIGAFHRREIAFYAQIVPNLVNIPPALSSLIPRVWAWADCAGDGCLDGAAPNVAAFLLMEDMSAGGQWRHVEGELTRKQIDSVIVAIARFHAHSLAIPADLVQTHFWPEKTFRFDKTRLHKQLCSLPGQTGAYFTANAAPLAKFIERTESGQEADARMAQQFALNPPVLCHGDLWLNNMLFDDNGVKGILDWQCVHVGTGLSDICHFLLTALNPPMRRQNTAHWLQLYHATLVDSLLAMPNPPETPLTNLDTIHAIYRAQFPGQVHFLACLEVFFASKPSEDGVRERMRERLVQAFEEIRGDFD